MSDGVGIINSVEYSIVVNRLREFFLSKKFVEVHTQSRLSILAACEDPKTISTYNYMGQVWPLPQTGQMWLEHELLKSPDTPGFFCVSTSFRNEPNPIPGRHDKVFPMFEFETRGNLDELIELEYEMLEFLGFGERSNYTTKTYDEYAKQYDVDELTHAHEEQMSKDYGPVCLITKFPNHTSPFWNMRQSPGNPHAEKIDVILWGCETIGSAERSCDPIEMRNQFYSISDGGYSDILFSNFTKERVQKELEDFLCHNFFERCGGGIGVTRLLKAMKRSNLI